MRKNRIGQHNDMTPPKLVLNGINTSILVFTLNVYFFR
jgi:hypothetical protein